MVCSLALLPAILTLIPTSHAWYSTVTLPQCEGGSQWWDDLSNPGEETKQILLGPAVATPPYTEGEFYSLPNRNITLQCLLEKPPLDSLISLTYNTSYMDNMQTLVTTLRCEGDDCRREETGGSPSQACTIAVFDSHNLQRVFPLPPHLPPACQEDRMAQLSVSLASPQSPHILLSIPDTGLAQTGTYQCSLLRQCQPSNHSQAEGEMGAPIAVTKSLYLMVYSYYGYQSDLIIALSGLAISFFIALLSAAIGWQPKDSVDHL